jgi:hypothetical protein
MKYIQKIGNCYFPCFKVTIRNLPIADKNEMNKYLFSMMIISYQKIELKGEKK